MVHAAGIYARISDDRDGTAAGVGRQLDDCRKKAADLGWTILDEYVDNDVSAYTGRIRPEYRRLLGDIAERRVDAVLVWDLDRLHRSPAELEDFFRVVDGAGGVPLASATGNVNLATPEGQFHARIMGAVAAKESADKSRRISRKSLENAREGKPHGGGNRPFGYEADRVTLVPAEAEVVQDLATRFQAGESLTSLSQWLNDNQVPSASGMVGKWRTPALRSILHGARISGRRERYGEILGPAIWPAIITAEESDHIRAVLDNPERRTNRTARSYLLSGMVRCGKCGARMVSNPREGRRRYACKAGADFGGCNGTFIQADPLESWIADAVLLRLDTPELSDALAGRSRDSNEAVALSEQIEADQRQMTELADLYARRQVTAAEWLQARNVIEQRLRPNQRRLDRLTHSTALDGFVGNGEGLGAQWAGLNLDRQRAIIGAVLDHVTVGAGRPGRRPFDPSRVEPMWRL